MDLAVDTDLKPVRMGSGSILAWSVWVGLVSGTLELAIFWMKCRFLDPRNMNVSCQFVWMFPVAGFFLLSGLGISLVVVSWFWSKPARPVYVLFALFFLAFVGLMFRAPVYTSACLLLAAVLAWWTSEFLAKREAWLSRQLKVGLLVPLGLLGLTVGVSLGWDGWRRDPDRDGHGQGRKPEPLRLWTRHDARTFEAGEAGHPVRPCVLDRSLDGSFACESFHRKMASRIIDRLGSAARRHLSNLGGRTPGSRLFDRRIRGQYHVLQL
jgi:hypothetical protein